MIDDGILLIVDDAASNRLLLKAIFKNEYKIEEAENGQQALEVLERSEGRVLAILLDLVMPVMDGYQSEPRFYPRNCRLYCQTVCNFGGKTPGAQPGGSV